MPPLHRRPITNIYNRLGYTNPMKLTELQAKYPNQCLILKPTKFSEDGEVLEGELLATGKTAKEALDKLKKKPKKTALFYTSKLPPMHSGGQPFSSPKKLPQSLREF